MLVGWCLEVSFFCFWKKWSEQEYSSDSSLSSLINNQNLVSLKNPPSIEFNTSIFGVRVPSFQFHSNKYPEKSKRAQRVNERKKIPKDLSISCRLLPWRWRGGKTKQSKSYYRRSKLFSLEHISLLLLSSRREKTRESFWCGRVLVSRIQVIHCDDSKCTRSEKVESEPLKGNLIFRVCCFKCGKYFFPSAPRFSVFSCVSFFRELFARFYVHRCVYFGNGNNLCSREREQRDFYVPATSLEGVKNYAFSRLINQQQPPRKSIKVFTFHWNTFFCDFVLFSPPPAFFHNWFLIAIFSN